jgi:signal transduction histidine kinase
VKPDHRLRAGKQGGRLLLAAGAFTLVNNYLPGSGHLDIAVLNAVALTTLALGVLCLRIPWDRLHPRTPLLVVLAGFALIAVSNVFGGVSAFSYAVYYVVVFVWVGLAQPPGTSLLLSPLAVVAYVVPFLVREPEATAAVSSVAVAVPVCVLVGEVLASSVRRLERSHADVVAQREHEQALVDVLADGVLVLDAGGDVVSCNRSAGELLDAPAAQLVGAPVPVPVGPPGTPVQAQVGSRWVETVATVLPETGERVVAVRDVSRAHALDAAKDLFLATTSHELRTPLTAIKGYVHVLQRRWDQLDDDARQQALRTIAERTDALVTLTDHLLLGARAGASRHSATREPYDVVRAVEAAGPAYADLSSRHRLVLDLPPAPVRALGDPSSVPHVVGQLVENAVKYSPAGGEVRVGVRTSGGWAVIEVSDQGIGIPAGQQDALFTPFFQAGSTNTREFGGVGLGLYIVRQLVEAQGGSVTAANRPGGGALMTVSLPLVPAESSRSQQEPAGAAPADDEPAVGPADGRPAPDAPAPEAARALHPG